MGGWGRSRAPGRVQPRTNEVDNNEGQNAHHIHENERRRRRRRRRRGRRRRELSITRIVRENNAGRLYLRP